MIVLQPTSDQQEFYIMPRFNDILGIKATTIRKDGTGETQSYLDNEVTIRGGTYYMTVLLQCDLFEEGCTYSIEIINNSRLWYRDKIYITSQNDYKVKHQLAQPSYTEYNDVDDNTYVIK